MKKTDVFGIMISEFGIAFGSLSAYNNSPILLFDME